ncbi:MAG: type I-C CRISPR-associated protein Cas7/Csd2 [Verrucomicrobiales bacterium]
MSKPIENRYDFIYLCDITRGNPNGDPDSGDAPRMDHETGHGFVSDVCLKRKIRNFITLEMAGKPGFDIYVKEKAILNYQHQRAHDAPGINDAPEGADREELARRWMCQTFFDIRMFGAVMTTGVNCGQVRGPVQLGFSKSISPISAQEQSITRMAVTTEAESKDQKGGNRTMGRKDIIPYALYECHGFINAHLAEQTGFSEDDLDLLWRSLDMMFEQDRSAARAEMEPKVLLLFKHGSKLGSARAGQLFRKFSVTKVEGIGFPRSVGDYHITFDGKPLDEFIQSGTEKDLDNGVTLIRRI